MIVFDDNHAPDFYPLTFTRAIGDLRCGILKLRQRLQSVFDAETQSVWIAPRLLALYRERHPDWLLNRPAAVGELLVNSRLKIEDDSIAAVSSLKPGQCLCRAETVLALRPRGELPTLPELSALQTEPWELVSSDLATYDNLADLVHDNERMLGWDFERYFYDQDNYFETEPGVSVLNPYLIWLAEGVELAPGVVLDASSGPIVIDAGARLLPNAVVTGPVYIGKNCLVKVAAKIYGPSSIGPVCKVGGEIEGTIFQGYSNKQHDGFLGHSYVGEWVNIGADTNNSDLKNTYQNVSFYSYAAGEKIDSGSMFLGALIGDHAKLGINTSINTGCVIGVGANLWGSDLIADRVPDFSWGPASRLVPYKFPAFCLTAAIVKERRKLVFSPAEKELLRQLWTDTHGGS